MKTLDNLEDRRRIMERLSLLTENDAARWGRMSVSQMVCHMNDSFQLALGYRKAAAISTPLPPAVLKWLALKAPAPWPKGVRTIPEVEQGKGGTPPVSFASDHAALMQSAQAFCARLPSPCVPHPMFQEMSEADWRRWGYLHTDHHLRQFGR